MAADGSYKDNATPAGIVSGTWGVEKITLAAVTFTGNGANQPCREVVIWGELAKVITIGPSAAAAATGLPLLTGIAAQASPQYLRIPISNTNKLFFKGAAEDDVHILWRS
ncbi:MAG TPA: hypothetical protein ENI05_00425 [Porticoccus sp.]|nr:hypothetical protein [Porticoccus sp.]